MPRHALSIARAALVAAAAVALSTPSPAAALPEIARGVSDARYFNDGDRAGCALACAPVHRLAVFALIAFSCGAAVARAAPEEPPPDAPPPVRQLPGATGPDAPPPPRFGPAPPPGKAPASPRREVITGTTGDDYIVGTTGAGRDRLSGGSGRDRVVTRPGDGDKVLGRKGRAGP